MHMYVCKVTMTNTQKSEYYIRYYTFIHSKKKVSKVSKFNARRILAKKKLLSVNLSFATFYLRILPANQVIDGFFFGVYLVQLNDLIKNIHIHRYLVLTNKNIYLMDHIFIISM